MRNSEQGLCPEVSNLKFLTSPGRRHGTPSSGSGNLKTLAAPTPSTPAHTLRLCRPWEGPSSWIHIRFDFASRALLGRERGFFSCMTSWLGMPALRHRLRGRGSVLSWELPPMMCFCTWQIHDYQPLSPCLRLGSNGNM